MAKPREQRRRGMTRVHGDGSNKFSRRMKALLAKAPPGWTPPYSPYTKDIEPGSFLEP